MILLMLLIGVVLFAAVMVFLIFGGVLKVEGDQKKAESNSAQILDDTFDGRETVTFTTHMRTLKYETVIIGAKERGYKLVNQSAPQYGALIFEKV